MDGKKNILSLPIKAIYFFTFLFYGSSYNQEVFSENSQDQGRHLWMIRILKNELLRDVSESDLCIGRSRSPLYSSHKSRLCRDQNARGSLMTPHLSQDTEAHIRDSHHRLNHRDLRDHQGGHPKEVREDYGATRLVNSREENPRHTRRIPKSRHARPFYRSRESRKGWRSSHQDCPFSEWKGRR